MRGITDACYRFTAYRFGMKLVAGVALVACLVAGCGSNADDQAWRADVEAESGAVVNDWEQYRDTWLDVCDDSKTAFGLFVATALDNGTTMDALRTNVRYACPDRLAEIEETRSGISGVGAACEMEATERSEEQARLAEAMGC